MLYQRCDLCGARAYHLPARPPRTKCPSCGRGLTQQRLSEDTVRKTLYPRRSVERVG